MVGFERNYELGGQETSMTVGAILDEIRDLYVSRLVAAVVEAKQDPDTSVIVEPELIDAQGDLVTEGILDLGVRHDFAIRSATTAEVVRVDSDRIVSFSPFEFQWDTLTVHLQPFQWDYCEINLTPPLDADGRELVAGWFRRWFDPADPDAEVLGVTHFLSDPEQNGAYQRYYVDFGTAPVEAFEQLLDACVRGGVTAIVVGTTAP